MLSRSLAVDLDLSDTEEIARRLAPYGNIDNGLRKSKPDDNGLIQYIWRMARFHSGANTDMPVTPYLWLQNYLDDRNIDASVTGYHDKAGNEIMDELDEVVTKVLQEEFDLSDEEAAKCYRRAGLI